MKHLRELTNLVPARRWVMLVLFFVFGLAMMWASIHSYGTSLVDTLLYAWMSGLACSTVLFLHAIPGIIRDISPAQQAIMSAQVDKAIATALVDFSSRHPDMDVSVHRMDQ